MSDNPLLDDAMATLGDMLGKVMRATTVDHPDGEIDGCVTKFVVVTEILTATGETLLCSRSADATGEPLAYWVADGMLRAATSE